MPKNIKIRHAIVGRVLKAGNRSEKLMSASEMARHFGVARSTVCLSLKDLVRDGYILSKPGIGIFTNPKKFSRPPGKGMLPLIGGIIGSGQNYFFTPSGWKSFVPLGDAATAKNMNFRHVTLDSTRKVDIPEQIFDMSLDGLLWVDRIVADNEPFLEKIAAKIPFVCDNPYQTRVNVVGYYIDSALYEMGKSFLARGKKSFLICLFRGQIMCEIPLFLRPFREAGIQPEIVSADLDTIHGDLSENTRKIFDSDKYDVCIAHELFIDFCREHCPKNVEVYPYWSFRDASGIPMQYVFPHRERAERMIERILEIRDGDRTIRRELLPMRKVFSGMREF